MKLSILIVVLGMSLFLISWVNAREIGFIEDFSLADDRSEVLKQLIPGTSDHYYYHCLHAQHLGDARQVRKMLELWIKRDRYAPGVKEILNRQALLEYEQHPEKSLEHIRRELNISFDHQKETAAGKSTYPSVLDQELISIPRLMDRAFSRYQNLKGIDDAGLDILPHEKLNPDRRRDLLQRLRRPDIPKLAKLVAEDLRDKNSSGFGSFPIHSNLLKSQLDECLALMPELLDNTEFVNTYLSKLTPSDDVDIRYDIGERKAYLGRLWDFVKRLAPAHNSLKAHVLYQILDMNRQEGNYDHRLFMEYVKLPRNIHYMNPDYLNLRKLRHVKANLNADFSDIVIIIPPIGTDEELVRDYLSHFFVKAKKNYKEYARFIRDTYLRQVFAESKILNGIGDMEQWYSMMNPAEYQRLKDRVDIDFALANKNFFATDEPVSLNLHIKNVATLIVKVFELNTFNFYQSNMKEIDTALNLDGLTATWEEVLKYDDPPLRRVLRSFDFPQISKQGVFVAEFIGNGRSSRAVIRKGRLYFTEKIGPAGHEFVVRNEKNEKCPEASIWMRGREYKPGDDGVIIIPFSNNPQKQSVVIRNGDFCSLASFGHLAENYDLSAGFYADLESLIKGGMAKVLVRPMLTLNGHPVSLSLLENVRFEIASEEHEGISATKEIADFELSEDKESVYEFQVPDNLNRISFTLKAQIQNMSRNRKEDFTAHELFQINQIDHGAEVESVFLSHASDSHVLSVIGKNGETKANRAVNLKLRHRCFREVISISLQTDEKGHIRLGKLRGIKEVEAEAGAISHKWDIPGDKCDYPGNIHASSGEIIRIPHEGAGEDEFRPHYVLLEKRGQSYLADRSEAIKINNGFLEISGLPPGDYELFLKEDATKINICLTDGETEDGFVISKSRILETKNESPLQISDIRTDDSFVRIELGNFSEFSRVHVFATRFEPEFSAFDKLVRSDLAEPYQIRQTEPESQYIAGRNIGDEYRYILERKYAKKFPGNMLNRPELLLNPWNIRKTETATDEAKAGEAYAARATAPFPQTAMREASSDVTDSELAGVKLSSNLDFLARASAVLVNLKPDENGVISIDRKLLGNHQQLHVLAADLSDTVCREVSLPEMEMKTRDLRLARSFDAEKHLTEQKLISLISPKETFRIENLATSEFELYDSLNKSYELLTTLSSNETLKEFAFILRWPEMNDVEKQEKYSEYACHELNFFLCHKDKTFFDDVVLPYLRNKKDKTFLDRWLMRDDLSEYLNPWAYSQLNIVEKILLSRRGDRDGTARHVRDLFDMIPPNVEEYNRLFDTALRGRAFEDAKYFTDSDGNGFEYDLDDEVEEAEKPDISLDNTAMAEAAPMMEMSRKAKAIIVAGKSGRKASPPSRRDVRKKMRQFFQKLDKTEEWAENNYYKLPIEAQNAKLVTVNAFWKDYAESDPKQPFLSKNFACAHRNFPEMMLALSVLDLPFKPGKHDTGTQDAAFSLTAASPVIVFHKEVRESRPAEAKTPVMISQHFFDPGDRFYHKDNERFDKYVEDEFLFRKPYGCQVVVSNPSSTPLKLTALLQIPSGAMPLVKGFHTRNIPLHLLPYATEKIEYYFYFPETGSFRHYPVQIAKNEQFLRAADASELKVVEELSKTDTASWDYVSQNGTRDEVLEFLRTHNLNRLDLDKMAFRMKDRDFFNGVILLLEERQAYQHTLWSYGIYHNDLKRISEFLRHSPFAEQCGTYISTPLLTVNPVERKRYQHLGYKPLVNARAHCLGKDRKILNDRFYDQYERFMKYLSCRPRLTNDDLTATVYYLLLQDRVSRAISLFERIDGDKLETRIQYDYLQAYLDFYTEKFDSARSIAEKYADYPVPKWRKLFRHVTGQLAEARGKSSEITETREQIHTKLAVTEPGFEFKVESDQIRITYQNLDACRVNYYPMDIELLFSRNPFVRQRSEHFAFIRPNVPPGSDAEIRLPPGETKFSFDLPEAFRNANLMVEITAGGVKKSQAYYANALDVQLIENYGYLRVRHQDTQEVLAKVYVKVYARMRQGGYAQFYKDGYSDLRGRFDYVSLSTDELDRVEKFAILILTEEHGALIREAVPPKR